MTYINVESQPTEVDCPWFDPAWLLDHPEFPLAATLAVEIEGEES